jgi:hypothetical protein
MSWFRRLAMPGFLAVGLTLSLASAATDSFLAYSNSPITYGEAPQVTSEALLDADCSSPNPFRPGRFTIEVDGSPVGAARGSLEIFRHCATQQIYTVDTYIDDIPFGTHAVTAAYTPSGASAPIGRTRPITLVVNPQSSAMTSAGIVAAGIRNPSPGYSMSWYCAASSVQVHPDSSVGSPQGATLDSGVLEYQASGCGFECGFLCPAGIPTAPQQYMLVQMPQPIPPDAQFWIYSTGPGTSGGWQPVAADVQGYDASLLVTGGSGQSALSGLIAMTRPMSLAQVQDMWWAGPEENGWGLSIAQNGDRLFIGLYVYRDDGTPEWLVMPLGSWDSGKQAYTGVLYEPHGSWFGQYDVSRFDAGNPVGQVALSFSSDSSATLDYTIHGASGRKSIRRLPFGSSATPPVQGEHAGLWWAGPARTGWGLAIGHQGTTLFSVWYTYAKDGTTAWYVMPGGSWTSTDTYSGPLYRTTGKSWRPGPYDPSAFRVAPAGTMTLRFTGPATGTMSYTVDGVPGTEAISLQPF